MLLVGIAVTVGLLLARQAQPGIESEIRAFVIDRGVTGYDMSGRVPPHQIEIYSEVDFPFVVSGTFAVPRDLHASYYRTRFLVLPWGRYVLSKDAAHVV